MKNYSNFEAEICGTNYKFKKNHKEDIPEDKFIEEGFTNNLIINKEDVSPNVWKRYKVLKRDNFVCQHCGAKADRYFKLVNGINNKSFYVYFTIDKQTRKVFTVDHKIPKSYKGDKAILSIIGNYQTLCRTCNILKGKKMPINKEIIKGNEEICSTKWARIKSHLVAIIKEIF
ncbi:MAG: HNH endonuclease signature motif containing protein [Endomicrobiaceae bacterium]